VKLLKLTILFLLCFLIFSGNPLSDYQPIQWTPDVITLNTNNIDQRREQLIDYVWGTNGWPRGKLPIVFRNLNYTAYWTSYLTNCPNLKSMDYGWYDMPLTPNEGKITTYFFRLVPTSNYNGNLFIYHAGHSSGFAGDSMWFLPTGTVPMHELVKEGYEVIGMNMPLMDGNSPVPITLLNGTQTTLSTHEDLYNHLDHPLRYFFDKIPVIIDYYGANNYHHIYMMGLSGGGWTTTIYSALDRRISASFSVADSIPLYLRVGFEGLGDAEQIDPLFHLANYSEFYVMGTYKNRLHYQLLNKYDDCCFYEFHNGAELNRYLNWVPNCVWKSQELSEGRFRFYLSTSIRYHGVSADTMKVIIDAAAEYSKTH
jgi:hypothetical protein